ncbi:hypothetical protein PHYBLDRAFT_111198 [Phycomyces blakesleeanus NRRL 1555(-)]|uniref:TBP-associated factor 12 n=1 Tax=Phycomyces blakesleeanus (strain ATCC 8743b / DSM 1359 / FGSC 10004 / NBRC 33097 / NRRL 1555) TaxID=763407 RepID=A0A162UGY5_PHYB8|nr:hypothetical protein PHYBLDRAFT_111198 [Phycomyces blakesleeanus NRRL 1555(-)]OAD75133.1 hypothetical protein PHYBLDRAFT_111198 [Phycomyces blakesleeanus NRRL 1555(-)]|eukprot:XP_018293173.1 hypothetical protein PHYBLDRAFT_111198 [Phycomyces blakesleeanus NRRL 1555(-)]
MDSGTRVLAKRKIQELVGQIDPDERLEPEVEDILLEIADEFIESVTSFACRLAKHRKTDTLEVKDLQLHLGRSRRIKIDRKEIFLERILMRDVYTYTFLFVKI